ncbi:MAG: tetratricopeptide repeat protein [Chlamydiota bacterium]
MTPPRPLIAACAALCIPLLTAIGQSPADPFGPSLAPLAEETGARAPGATGDAAAPDAVAVDPLSADSHFRLGVRYRAEGESQKAAEQFRTAAELRPSDPAPRLNLGIVYGEMGRLDEAQVEFARVLEIDPGSLSALFNRGVIFMRQRKQAEAISSFEKALMLGGSSVPVHYNLAVCYEYANGERYGPGFQAGKSAVHYRKVLEKQPGNAIARFNLGMVCLHGGDAVGAEQELKLAAELDRGMADASYQLGLLMLRKKSYHSAVRYLREARRVDPELPTAAPLADACCGLGQFYLDNADFESAKKNFEEALAIDPARVQALVQLGRAQRGVGDFAGAVHCFTTALSTDDALPLSGELASTYAQWGDALDRRGSREEAAAKYEDALHLQPGDWQCLKKLAALYRGPLGSPGKAIYLYRKALSSDDIPAVDAEELRKELAGAMRDGGELMGEYRALAQRNPDNATLRYNLAVFHHERNELDAAMEEYKKTIRIDPEHSYAHYNLGLIYQKKGMRSAALREFKLALHFNPEYHRGRYALGRLYEELGAFDKAREEYENALSNAPAYAEAHLALGILLRGKLKDEKAAQAHLDRYRELKAAMDSRRDSRAVVPDAAPAKGHGPVPGPAPVRTPPFSGGP